MSANFSFQGTPRKRSALELTRVRAFERSHRQPMTDEYQHPAFPPPPHPDVVLWRYLDFHKFDWLVNCGRLFMPAAHLLGDPLEGTAPAGTLEWWHDQAASATSEEQRRVIVKNQEMLAAFAAAFRSHYYVSCWHMNAVESKKMWQCYTRSHESVAVKTSYRALRAALPAYVEIGMVRYIDYANERLPTLNMFEYITHKNIGYCFEREVRVVALQPVTDELGRSHFQERHFESETIKGFLVFAPEIDVRSLIHGVVLHPESKKGFAERIRAMCASANLPEPLPSSFSKQGSLVW